MVETGLTSGEAPSRQVQLAAHLATKGASVAVTTKLRTYRLPIDLWDRIRALQEQREAEIRSRLDEHQHGAVRVQEIDVVKELLERGLAAVEAEGSRPSKKRR